MRLQIGVLGGMGAIATSAFIRNTYTMLKDIPEKELKNLFVDISNDTPSRTLAYIGDGASPVKSLLERINNLTAMGAGRIYFPCNSVHYWRKELIEATGVDWPSIIEVTAEAAVRKVGCKMPRALILGAAVTVGTDLYGGRLETVYLPDPAQKELEALILSLKQGEVNVPSISSVIRDEVVNISPDIIVNACTELWLVDGIVDIGIPVVDSNYEYAKKLAEDLRC